MKKTGILLSILLFSLLTVMPTITLPSEAQADKGPKVWFSLSTLYEVHLDLDINLSKGSELYVVFHSYLGEIEENVTVWSGITPEHVTLSVDVPHPDGKPVEKVILMLTDNAGIALSTLASFVVDRGDLMRRLAMLDMNWTVPGADRTAIMKEYVAIDGQWPYAPSKPSVKITVTSDLVTYEPSQNVTITANITNQWFEDITNATAKIEIDDSLGKQIQAWTRTLDRITAGETVSVQANWTAPNCTMAGFVAVVSLLETVGHNRTFARGQWVFDVVKDWTMVPRYGFFSTPAFSPYAENSAEKVEALKLFHINSLQFYDWFARHANYTPTESEYYTLWGAYPILRDRVIEIIGLAQKAGMKCMPYTVIYAAAPEFWDQHQDWGLYKSNGEPWMLGDFLYLMYPGRPCGWHDYLIDQFLASIEMFNWDGIHLDQYGYPKYGNTYWNDTSVDIVEAFQHFLNDAFENITQTYPEGKLIFNYVTNWTRCYEMMGKNTTVSALYAEVWHPYHTYSDIRYLIRQGKAYNSSKAVILAAYPTPSPPLPTVLLLDAEIFANQGFHIELGEGNKILTDAYFPRYSTMTEDMVKALRSYYECITRYEQLIYDLNIETLPISAVQVSDYAYGISPSSNSIQVIPYAQVVNGSEEARTIHFINFRGITNMGWQSQQPEPTETCGIPVEIQIPSEKLTKIEGVYLINPDSKNSDPASLSFTVNPSVNTINFTIPSLKYWDIVIIKYSNSTGSGQFYSQSSSLGGINSESWYVRLPIMVVFTVILITNGGLSKRFRREKMIK